MVLTFWPVVLLQLLDWTPLHCKGVGNKPVSEWFWFCAAEDGMDGKAKPQKRHQQKHSGPKAEKKKQRKQGASAEEDERRRNPKAFAVQSAVRMAKTFHRSGSGLHGLPSCGVFKCHETTCVLVV